MFGADEDPLFRRYAITIESRSISTIDSDRHVGYTIVRRVGK